MGITKHPRANRGRGWVGALLVAGLGHSLVTHAAHKDGERNAVLEQKLDQSLQLIRQLSARVEDLEAQAAHGAPPEADKRSGTAAAAAPAAAAQPGTPAAAQTGATAPTPPDTAQRLAKVEQTVNQMAASAGQHAEEGLATHGFADVGVGNRNAEFSKYQGADVGELDFFLTPRLGSRTRALFELNFEVGSDGNVGVDLERAQICYQFADSATVWLGRFHTPYGYYNTAFHHGQQIATSLRRPRFILFEDQGGVMPNHTVGAWLTGAEPLIDGKATYDLFVGNGQAISDGAIDPRSGGVDHGGAIYGGNLGYVFGEALNGLKIGASAFRSKITNDQPYVNFTRVDNVGVYFAYDTDRFEHIGEYYRFSDSELTPVGPTHKSSAGFLQLAWRLPFATPYARYERAALNQSDTYFAAQTEGMSYYRDAVGLRFDIDLKSALKFEVGRTKNTDRVVQEWTDVLMDYAIRF